MPEGLLKSTNTISSRYFIGGSDARIIVGGDEGALIRLWREKRGEIAPEDFSGNLIVQLGVANRGPQSALVSGQHRPDPYRRRAPGLASDAAVDGGNAGRPSRG